MSHAASIASDRIAVVSDRARETENVARALQTAAERLGGEANDMERTVNDFIASILPFKPVARNLSQELAALAKSVNKRQRVP